MRFLCSAVETFSVAPVLERLTGKGQMTIWGRLAAIAVLTADASGLTFLEHVADVIQECCCFILNFVGSTFAILLSPVMNSPLLNRCHNDLKSRIIPLFLSITGSYALPVMLHRIIRLAHGIYLFVFYQDPQQGHLPYLNNCGFEKVSFKENRIVFRQNNSPFFSFTNYAHKGVKQLLRNLSEKGNMTIFGRIAAIIILTLDAFVLSFLGQLADIIQEVCYFILNFLRCILCPFLSPFMPSSVFRNCGSNFTNRIVPVILSITATYALLVVLHRIIRLIQGIDLFLFHYNPSSQDLPNLDNCGLH